ncbi:unnamed protein product [Medioppia subpectinata]|uniref:Cyclin-like domain-containing protein n=1 Tax=Medioppia subpectinata TaxID=1979941 RepID=A0A7R9KMV3_9ACAR|nr:unnamed protein product [Medioppia subpectinata]CAG2105198.1 unnamed protein product [Medioppia subpectinata]
MTWCVKGWEVLATDWTPGLGTPSEAMAGSDRWYFDKQVLANTPSRRCGIDSDKELSYRQQAANLIQDMGQRLHVSQLCINTAIVYMHRFYTFHSFTKFHRNSISSCALFLAAKVEEQPRKLEHVIKVSHMCLHRDIPALDVKSEAYKEQAMELVFNENLMLQTLGFDIAVEHPHTSVVNCCQLVRASKDLAQTSYFMATNSLHLTTMCLQHKPTVVACVCIHLACKWSRWEIPRSSEGKDWFYYVDTSVTLDLLEQLTSEFLAILDKCPSRLKRKVITHTSGGGSSGGATHSGAHNSSLNKSIDEKRSSMHVKEELKSPMVSKSSSHHPSDRLEKMSTPNPTTSRRSPPTSPHTRKVKVEPTSHQPNQPLSRPPVSMSYAAYRERKANTQHDCPKPPPIQPNKSSIHPTNRDNPSNPQKERISPKQLLTDKQRQSEERHKLKPKTSEYLFESSNRSSIAPKPTALSSNPKSSQNNTNEDFYDLLNKPSSFNSIFSNDGDDSLDFKRDVVSNLQMEFSDNSNQSTDGLNLSSFPDFMNDSSDSKKSFINTNNNNSIKNNIKLETESEANQTSFMSIFSAPVTTTHAITPTTASTTAHTKSDNTKTNIPQKYSDVLSRIKPEPLPPMLSPLKSMADNEMVPKLEKPFASHSSLAQTHLKTNSNTELDLKTHQNSKISKSSPKFQNSLTQPQKGFVGSVVPTFKDKEMNESLPNIKLETMEMQPSIGNLNKTQNPMTIINTNVNDLINSSESLAPLLIKPENREKSLKAVEIPSVLSKNRPQMSSNLESDVKPNVTLLGDPKLTLNLSPNQHILVNNTSVVSDMTKHPVIPIKESKDKSSHSTPEEKHHKRSHHSHKSSKHRDKHKHKHKDKDRERHKHKDKDRDRDRDRSGDDPAFKISYSASKDKADISNNNSNTAPIKLKISKKKLSIDEIESSDKTEEPVQQNPLKLRIQLKDEKFTTNATDFQSNDSNSGRKRKSTSSPKSSKKDKQSKHENEPKVKEKSSKSKKSSSDSNSKKGSNHMISYDTNATQQQLLNPEIVPAFNVPIIQSRPHKTHK